MSAVQYASALERKRASEFRVMLARPDAFDVYLEPGHAPLRMRRTNVHNAPKPLPPNVVLIGRYKRPHPASLFVEDLRAVIAACGEEI